MVWSGIPFTVAPSITVPNNQSVNVLLGPVRNVWGKVVDLTTLSYVTFACQYPSDPNLASGFSGGAGFPTPNSTCVGRADGTVELYLDYQDFSVLVDGTVIPYQVVVGVSPTDDGSTIFSGSIQIP